MHVQVTGHVFLLGVLLSLAHRCTLPAVYTILIRPVSKRRRQEWGGDSALGLVGAAVLLLAMCPIDVSAWLGDLGAESVIARVQHFVEETLRQVSEIPYHLGPR